MSQFCAVGLAVIYGAGNNPCRIWQSTNLTTKNCLKPPIKGLEIFVALFDSDM